MNLENKKVVFSIGPLTNEGINKYSEFFTHNLLDLKYYSDTEKQDSINRRTVENLAKKIENPNFVFLVAKNSKGEIISIMEAEVVANNIPRYAILRWIIAGKNIKMESVLVRKNITIKLAEFMEEKLAELGCKFVLAEIKDDNKVSINLGRKYGFKLANLEHPKPGMKWYYREI